MEISEYQYHARNGPTAIIRHIVTIDSVTYVAVSEAVRP